VIGETVKQYKILSEIGGGGMGVVYLAHDTDLDCKVALKFLPPELTRSSKAKTRFRLEAQSAAALQHPHICTIHAISETDDGQMYICMPYYEGRSLKDYITDRKLPVREVYEIASCVADGLMAAHDNDPSIIHRDIKPANIMITKAGYVVVVDFGLAKLVGRTKVTMTGVTPGTASYMSPEQVQGKDLDGRTDIWSLGVVMYEALTGELPFGSDLEQALFYQIVNEGHKPAHEVRADVPQEFSAIVDKCLAKKPDDRYASMRELLTAMHKVAMELNWQSSTTVRPVLPIRTWEEQKRQRLLRWLVGAAILAVAAFVVYRVMPPREPPSPYVTDVRLATLPFENLASKDFSDDFVLGLSEWTAAMADRIRPHHESMWTIPFSYTRPGRVPTPADAEGYYGVNYLLTGSVQAFDEGHLISLDLVNASSLATEKTIRVSFDVDEFGVVPPALAKELLAAFGVDPAPGIVDDILAGESADSRALVATIETMGLLNGRRTSERLANAADLIAEAVQREESANGLTTAARVDWAIAAKSDAPDAAMAAALEKMRQAVALDSTAVLPLLALAHSAAIAGEREEAIDALDRVLSRDPGNLLALRRKAINLRQLQRFDEAEIVYEALVSIHPDLYDGLRLYGFLVDRLGNTDEAIDYYRQALVFAPNDSWTLKRLGLGLHVIGEWAEARKYYMRSFAIKPDCGTCTTIGQLYFTERMFEEAARYYEFAISYCDSTGSTYHVRWNNWGEALYWIEERRDEALPKYRRAIHFAERELAKTPDDPELLADLAALYASVGEQAKAIEFADRAAPGAVDDEMAAMTLAWTYEKLSNRELALQYIFTAIRHGFPIKDMEIEPLFTDLRADIRFQQFAEGIQKEAGGSSASN
jgi:serine/threonine-protein kinase